MTLWCSAQSRTPEHDWRRCKKQLLLQVWQQPGLHAHCNWWKERVHITVHQFLYLTLGQSEEDSPGAFGMLWIYTVRKHMQLLLWGWLWAETAAWGTHWDGAVTEAATLSLLSLSYFKGLGNHSGCCHCHHERKKQLRAMAHFSTQV